MYELLTSSTVQICPYPAVASLRYINIVRDECLGFFDGGLNSWPDNMGVSLNGSTPKTPQYDHF